MITIMRATLSYHNFAVANFVPSSITSEFGVRVILSVIPATQAAGLPVSPCFRGFAARRA